MLGFYLTLLETADEKNKFEELYNKYRDVLYNYAYGILHDRYLAEDAVHNAFLSLTKCLHKIHEVNCKETRNYLIIIVKNSSFKIYNQGKNTVELNDEIEDNCVDIEEYVEKTLTKEEIAQTIKDMDNIYSDILMLKYFYGLSDIEISKTLDISINNVWTRIHRGKSQLIKKLSEEHYDRN